MVTPRPDVAGCGKRAVRFKLVPIPAVTIGTHDGLFSRNLILSEAVRATISYNLISCYGKVLGSLLTSCEIYDDCGEPKGRAPEIQNN